MPNVSAQRRAARGMSAAAGCSAIPPHGSLVNRLARTTERLVVPEGSPMRLDACPGCFIRDAGQAPVTHEPAIRFHVSVGATAPDPVDPKIRAIPKALRA